MSGFNQTSLRLWDDNPSSTDLLGFDAVVAPILEALATPDLDPLTVGVHSPWGGGKSTVLRLLHDRLANDNHYLVIDIDPWRFDDEADVRGTLMAEVLDHLLETFDSVTGVREAVTALLKRISWGRVAAALGSGAVSMQWDVDKLVEAFTPKERRSTESMSGFRDQFAELMTQLTHIDRVVVLVDDLDRCLPEAVMATLEAIKLFLSVPKMVFVLAADQAMVRDAIAASLSRTSRSEAFADRYLEKIVQLPVTLPRLAPYDAEAYIGLLLAARSLPKIDAAVAHNALVEHCAQRRRAGHTALLAELDGLLWQPQAEVLQLAGQLAQGLASDLLANPRKIKRFLNAFGVRAAVAQARQVAIAPAVLAKMLLLEEQHSASFQTLAGAAAPARAELLQEWERWGRGETTSPPAGIEPATQGWAAASPSLADVNLAPYLVLAASLLNVGVGGSVSDEVSALVRSTLAGGEAARAAALQQLMQLPTGEQVDAIELMFTTVGRMDDAEPAFTAAAAWAAASPELVGRAVAGVRANWNRLSTGAVVDLAQSEVAELTGLLPAIAGDASLDQMVRDAARAELDR
jgi:hypothetical protein